MVNEGFRNTLETIKNMIYEHGLNNYINVDYFIKNAVYAAIEEGEKSDIVINPKTNEVRKVFRKTMTVIAITKDGLVLNITLVKTRDGYEVDYLNIDSIHRSECICSE